MDRAVFARRGIRDKSSEKGHCIGYTQSPVSGEIHVVGSVVAQLSAGMDLRDGIREEYFRYSKMAGRGRRNILFVVDTSGSMIALGRLALVKGCVVSLLSDAYVTRTRVAIVGYGGIKARVVVPFTSSAELAAQRIDVAKGGGATPLLDALRVATGIIDAVRDEPVEVVLLSDGGCDRPWGLRAGAVVAGFADFCEKRNVAVRFVDSGTGARTAQRRAKRLAAALHADYRRLDDMRADELAESLLEESVVS